MLLHTNTKCRGSLLGGCHGKGRLLPRANLCLGRGSACTSCCSALTRHAGTLLDRYHGKVLPGDVLMAINGVDISEAGEIVYRNHERLPFQYLITKQPLGQ